ncbi:MAG: class I SAM-dependent methyltransferase [Deltaproteobacteria bacterium]|nr:class I SAM-dependent methyltransferase [Deltaproteobacteria bacterium]
MPLSARLKFSKENELILNSNQTVVRDRIRSKMEGGEYALEEVACFCGETEALSVAERDRYGLSVNTMLCMNCGLMRTTPRLSKESTEQFYKEDYRALYSGHITREAKFQKDVEQGRNLVEQMPSLIGQVETVYDIGCGTGGLLFGIAETGKTVAGCDIDENYLAVGRDKGLDLICGGVQDLIKAKGGQADLVLLSHVAEHFLSLRAELEDAIQAIRPGGFLLVEVPGIRNIPDDYGGNLLAYLQNAHTYHFTGQTLSYVLRSMGLQVIVSNEQTMAAAMRPEGWAPGAPAVKPSDGEALSVLAFLAELEREYLFRDKDTQEGETGQDMETWPLGTEATLCILAWPKYDDLESLVRVLTVAEPLYGNPNACLCLRFDHETDIPYEEATKQLEKAFEKVKRDGDLNVLMLDEPIPKADWPRLGKAMTCVLQTDPEIDDIHTEFINALGIEIISGRE